MRNFLPFAEHMLRVLPPVFSRMAAQATLFHPLNNEAALACKILHTCKCTAKKMRKVDFYIRLQNTQEQVLLTSNCNLNSGTISNKSLIGTCQIC